MIKDRAISAACHSLIFFSRDTREEFIFRITDCARNLSWNFLGWGINKSDNAVNAEFIPSIRYLRHLIDIRFPRLLFGFIALSWYRISDVHERTQLSRPRIIFCTRYERSIVSVYLPGCTGPRFLHFYAHVTGLSDRINCIQILPKFFLLEAVFYVSCHIVTLFPNLCA